MSGPTLFMPSLLAPTSGPFATAGAEEFDAAVQTVESRRAASGHDKGPLAVHADGDIYGFDGVVEDFKSDGIMHPSGPDSWRRTLWKARYPRTATIEDYEGYMERPVVESPAWHGTRHPVSIDRVVRDFLEDGATETFLALPRPAQKMVALVQIASELKNEPHSIEKFADLVPQFRIPQTEKALF